MRYLLGISAFYHDAAAVLLDRGEIVAAAEEERWTRTKHDASFPRHAIAHCLETAGIDERDVDLVCYYEKPLRRLDRLIETYLAVAPHGFRSFARALPTWAGEKMWISRTIARELRGYRGRVVYPSHHESHAAAAFFPSPFERAAILTCDGVGEWATTTYGVGDRNRVRIDASISFPHSLGLLYSAFTHFAGFKVNSGEYKLMGLAPYGSPIYAETIRRELIDVREDGSFRLATRHFGFLDGLEMTNRSFARLFGGARRDPESPITNREADLAASVQLVLEEVLLRITRHLHRETRLPNLCLAGGVALNCVANARLAREGPFESVWIQPAAGDAGGALGAAMFAHHQLMGRERVVSSSDAMKGARLGPSFDDAQIRRLLEAFEVPFETPPDDASLFAATAAVLEEGLVVGWFDGRMEFGPRALGGRSILADARHPRMQETLNAKIKLREGFRPFAPAVLRERAHEVFDVPEGFDAPYMTFVANVRDALRREASDDPTLPIESRAARVRSTIPAVTHVDGSARLQTVDEARHGRFHGLLREFHARTGCPLLVNTSFNVRGEPIVRTPDEALACFYGTEMDVLVIGGHIVRKDSAAPPSRFSGDLRRRFERD